MTKGEKKKIFLIIIESLFYDRTREINKNNCITFYHYLVNTLEDELMLIPQEDEVDISLCFSIIELLCNFDLMNNEIEDWSKDSIQNFLQYYSGLTDEEIVSSLYKFRKIYTLIKDSFIIGLP